MLGTGCYGCGRAKATDAKKVLNNTVCVFFSAICFLVNILLFGLSFASEAAVRWTALGFGSLFVAVLALSCALCCRALCKIGATALKEEEEKV
jgi:hypothetical protein